MHSGNRQITFVSPDNMAIFQCPIIFGDLFKFVGSLGEKGPPAFLVTSACPLVVHVQKGEIAYLVFNLADVYDGLWKYLALRFNNSAPDEFIIPVDKDDKVTCTIIKEDVNIDKSSNELINSSLFDMFLDPKAIIKATIYPHVCTWSIRIMDLRQGFHNTLSFIQPIDYLMINLNVREEIIGSMIKEALTQESLSLKFLRLRSMALTRFIDILFERLSHSVDPFRVILETYCRFVAERGRKYIKRASKTNRISLNIVAYSQALAYALIEMGLHGISHSLIRYIASKLKFDVSRLREFIGVVVNVPSHVNDQIKALKAYLGIIDGYILRVPLNKSMLRDAPRDSIFGIIGVILPKPYSRKLISTIFQDNCKMLEEIINYTNAMINLRGIDSCYKTWLSNKGITDTTFSRTVSFLSRVNISSSCPLSLGDILSDIKHLTETRFNIQNLKLPNDLAKILYIPRVDYRRVLIKNILKRIIERELSKLGIKNPNILDLCHKDAKRSIKAYVPMIYETSVPYCFDGCYNCVLLKDCGSKHPIIREWIVSKAIMKIILQTI